MTLRPHEVCAKTIEALTEIAEQADKDRVERWTELTALRAEVEKLTDEHATWRAKVNGLTWAEVIDGLEERDALRAQLLSTAAHVSKATSAIEALRAEIESLQDAHAIMKNVADERKAENERLKQERQDAQEKLVQTEGAFLAEVARLQAENAKLREQVADWKYGYTAQANELQAQLDHPACQHLGHPDMCNPSCSCNRKPAYHHDPNTCQHKDCAGWGLTKP